MCGHETPICQDLYDNDEMKRKLGFITLTLHYDHYKKTRVMNFCPSCAKKSYTIEELKTIGNYNQWSY